MITPGFKPFEALLFDMDGTVLTSIVAAERIWSRWAIAHGLDVASFLPTIHGVQAVETIRRLNLAGIDPEAEAAAVTALELEDLDGVEEIAGARDFLSALPRDRWGIVTSAPRALALKRLTVAGLPIPDVLITAEDVERGKPAPDCYIVAANKLGVVPTNCLVFEDATAGIAAAEAAGASVVVVTATHHENLPVRHFCLTNYLQARTQSGADGTLQLLLD
jgi:sugar-phosphatase